MRPSQVLRSKRAEVLALMALARARNLRVFGSAARGDDTDGRDLDLLVDPPCSTSAGCKSDSKNCSVCESIC